MRGKANQRGSGSAVRLPNFSCLINFTSRWYMDLDIYLHDQPNVLSNLIFFPLLPLLLLLLISFFDGKAKFRTQFSCHHTTFITSLFTSIVGKEDETKCHVLRIKLHTLRYFNIHFWDLPGFSASHWSLGIGLLMLFNQAKKSTFEEPSSGKTRYQPGDSLRTMTIILERY